MSDGYRGMDWCNSRIEQLKRERDRLRDENYRLKVLLSETQGSGFPHVPAWFSEAVMLILEQEAGDD